MDDDIVDRLRSGDRVADAMTRQQLNRAAAEIQRLRGTLITCSDLAAGYKQVEPRDRCAAIVILVDTALKGFAAKKAGGDDE